MQSLLRKDTLLRTYLYFQIRVWKVQEDIRTATDHTVLKVMEASIDGLQKHTVYVLRVLGYSGGGDGALSESIYFTVLGKFSIKSIKLIRRSRKFRQGWG